MLEINERVVGRIEKLDHFGKGIIRYNGCVIFVDRVKVNDVVEIKIINKKKNFYTGQVTNYIEKDNNRREEMCPYQDICGGCNLLLLPYNEQLIYKEKKIKEIVNKYLKEDIKINKIFYSNEFNYRNKITLHVMNKKIGLYEEKNHKLVEISNCLLVNDTINKVIKRLKSYLVNYESDLTSITIKTTNLNELMIVLSGRVLIDDIKKEFFDINSIILNGKVIHGNDYIVEDLMGYRFLIREKSFFQVNMFNTSKLYSLVLRYLENKEYVKVLDLYCGTGTIGIIVSKYCKSVIGIEVVSDAIKSAKENALINGIDNINFILGKVEDNLDNIKDCDLIIVDPPREGLDKRALNNIININPSSIIYVSCDPMTLVRDLKILKDSYEIIEFNIVDMFPNTYHVECCVLLETKKDL